MNQPYKDRKRDGVGCRHEVNVRYTVDMEDRLQVLDQFPGLYANSCDIAGTVSFETPLLQTVNLTICKLALWVRARRCHAS